MLRSSGSGSGSSAKPKGSSSSGAPMWAAPPPPAKKQRHGTGSTGAGFAAGLLPAATTAAVPKPRHDPFFNISTSLVSFAGFVAKYATRGQILTPSVQRPYEWGQREVMRVLASALKIVREMPDDDAGAGTDTDADGRVMPLMLQTITLAQLEGDSANYYVLDGLQRLTTLMLITGAARSVLLDRARAEKLNGNSKTILDMKLKVVLRNLDAIIVNELGDGQPTLFPAYGADFWTSSVATRLDLDGNLRGDDPFTERVVRVAPATVPTGAKRYHTNAVMAWTFLDKNLATVNDACKFVRVLLDASRIIATEYTGLRSERVFRLIFLNINDTGKPLADEDVIKVRLAKGETLRQWHACEEQLSRYSSALSADGNKLAAPLNMWSRVFQMFSVSGAQWGIKGCGKGVVPWTRLLARVDAAHTGMFARSIVSRAKAALLLCGPWPPTHALAVELAQKIEVDLEQVRDVRDVLISAYETQAGWQHVAINLLSDDVAGSAANRARGFKWLLAVTMLSSLTGKSGAGTVMSNAWMRNKFMWSPWVSGVLHFLRRTMMEIHGAKDDHASGAAVRSYVRTHLPSMFRTKTLPRMRFLLIAHHMLLHDREDAGDIVPTDFTWNDCRDDVRLEFIVDYRHHSASELSNSNGGMGIGNMFLKCGDTSLDPSTPGEEWTVKDVEARVRLIEDSIVEFVTEVLGDMLDANISDDAEHVPRAYPLFPVMHRVATKLFLEMRAERATGKRAESLAAAAAALDGEDAGDDGGEGELAGLDVRDVADELQDADEEDAAAVADDDDDDDETSNGGGDGERINWRVDTGMEEEEEEDE